MTIGINKTFSYELCIHTEPDIILHYDLNKWRYALEDFIEFKETDEFWFGIQITDEEGCDWVDAYRTNKTNVLPKYVRKYVDKVLEEARKER